MNELRGGIQHLNRAASVEAATAIIASVTIVIKVVHCLLELLSILNLGGGSLGRERCGRRVHVVVDVIGYVGYIVEHVATEVLEALLSEVTLALHEE